MKKMIDLIVFDLDDTLLDTSGLLIPIAHTEAFYKAIQSSLPLMDGAMDNLIYLEKKYQLVLLTQGKKDIQQKKIDSLKIADKFNEIYIAQTDHNENKAQYFLNILNQSKISAEKCLSIGNRRSVDIREAKRLGYKTCYFHHGEHKLEQIESELDSADFSVEHHKDLIRVCGL